MSKSFELEYSGNFETLAVTYALPVLFDGNSFYVYEYK